MRKLLVANGAIAVLFAGILIGALSGPIVRAQAQPLKLDGSWWLGLSSSEKVSAAQGMLIGYQYGFAQMALALFISRANIHTQLPGAPTPSTAPTEDAYYSSLLDDAKTRLKTEPANIVAALDAAYLHHPKARTIPVGSLFPCALAIDVSSCDEQLTHWEQSPPGPGHEPIFHP